MGVLSWFSNTKPSSYSGHIPICEPVIGEAEEEKVLEVLRSGMIAGGSRVEELEQKFAKLCGVKHAVAVNSGTAALHAALNAIGIGSGDEVITTPFTFVATPNSVMMEDGQPVFADIKKDTFNIDPKRVEEKITDETKAILAVDLYGQPHDVEELRRIADDYNLSLIDDAAQAVCAEYQGRKAGSYADISAFSFYATKNLTTAEGGMITTDKQELAQAARRFRKHGSTGGYNYDRLGYNYAMSDVHAAIGLAQINKIEEWTKKRNNHAELLTDALKEINGIQTPMIKSNVKHAFHQYTIRVKEAFPGSREQLRNHLEEKDIGTGVYYPQPLHLSSHLDHLNYEKGDFPVAEKASEEVLSLPVHPNVSAPDVRRIVQAVKNYE